MNNIEILKRLYKDYTKKYLNKIFIAVFFSILVAGSTYHVSNMFNRNYLVLEGNVSMLFGWQ